jgi:hypothetical protein
VRRTGYTSSMQMVKKDGYTTPWSGNMGINFFTGR